MLLKIGTLGCDFLKNNFGQVKEKQNAADNRIMHRDFERERYGMWNVGFDVSKRAEG